MKWRTEIDISCSAKASEASACDSTPLLLLVLLLCVFRDEPVWAYGRLPTHATDLRHGRVSCSARPGLSSVLLSLSVLHTLSHCLSFTVASLFSCYLCRFNPLTPTATIWVQLCTQGWASECPDVKNYKWQHGMLYSCIHMATVVIEWCLRCVGVDSNSVTWVVMSTESVNTWFMINICSIRDGRPSSLTLMTSPGTTQYLVISFCVSSLWTDHYVVP